MPGAVDFKERISRQRPHDRETYGHAGNTDLQDIVYQLESDRGRIVNSAAVRRLQQKTQVFPLERNAAVRSRLTHSLEVQQTGRFIVRTLFRQLGPRAAEVGLDGLEGALESLVEMACLMHDVGNPPFGHFGEYAINDWFERNLDALFERRVPPGQGDGLLQQRMLTDLKHFEGNAQAIRLVVKLLRLNLTYTQTAGLLKYVRPAYEPKPDKAAANHYLNKKPGFYLSEEAFVGELRQVLGMRPGTRHPVAYIMEAADDISYCLADIEDSVEKGILDIRQLADLLVKKFAVHHSPDAPIPGDADNMSFQRMVDYSLEKAEREPINKVSEFFIRLRVKMIHPLVQHAAQQFIDNLEAVHAGTLGRALMEDGSLPHAIVQTFKDVAMEWVFCHPEVETLELQGYRIIQGLLDFYAPLLRLPAEEFQALAEGRQAAAPHPQLLVRRLPSQQIKAYLEAMKGVAEDPLPRQWEFYHRCRMLQDFVSGMTDQHAQDEYRALSAL
ncbi:dGTPase [Pseudomonas aeruginosa]|uniref:dGTPase n=1 Tax=Pseudomonas aeruginosa TaxID=287 RepID=UPI000465EDE6|nr:dGTPase [Pseudomonas aeruginosa]EKV4569431.1 dGTPase [Pseudomonas aeruginosa]EKV4571601.1 dGTPase [Pseudomonas aeruginosa]MBI8967209.1 dGTPase [Pseudomonas aeruginosa]MBU8391188.1 dGTPase [Pseudomonas aeruginosa]MBY1009211.1 dGTPase [Pseudomonas aeruginosa]